MYDELTDDDIFEIISCFKSKSSARRAMESELHEGVFEVTVPEEYCSDELEDEFYALESKGIYFDVDTCEEEGTVIYMFWKDDEEE